MKSLFKKILSSLLCSGLLTAASFSAARAQTRFWSTSSQGGAQGVGTIISIDPGGKNMQIRHTFQTDGIDGNAPSGRLTQAGGLLYGLTNAGGTASNGTIFSIDTVSGSYQKVYDFTGGQGGNPSGGLVLYKGILYGVAGSGGANGMGAIFSYDPVSNTYTDLYDLNPATGTTPAGELTIVNDQLFFSCFTQDFSAASLEVYHLDSHTCNIAYNFPLGSNTTWGGDLIFYNNQVYGLIPNGGQYALGELFSFDPVAHKLTSLYTFTDQTQGYNPQGMTLYNNKFYGTAFSGGTTNYFTGQGTLFSFDPAKRTYTDLFNFDPALSVTNGGNPYGSPLIYNGQMIGSTIAGGNATAASGVVYAFNLSTGTFAKWVDIDGINGSFGTNPFIATGPPVPPGTASQTISFSDIAATYGDPDFNLQATASSGLPVSYSTSDYTVGSMNGNGIHIAGAGTCTITATQTGDGTYAAAAPVSITLTVSKAPLLIRADDKIAYQNQPIPPLTISYSGFANGEDSSYLLSLPVASCIVDASTPHGTYPITVSGATSNNYAITYQNGTFYVYGLQQSFTVTDTAATYGDADFAVATASSGLPVTYAAHDPAIAGPSSTPGLLHIKGAGTTVLTIIQAGNDNYAPGTDSVTLTVSKAPLTITANNQSTVYDQPDPLFSVTYSGFVNGEDSSALITPPLVISSATSKPAYPGTYLIEISGAVSQNYAFTYVNGVFTVTLPGDSLNAWCSSPTMLTVNILSTSAQKAQLALYSLAGQRALTSEMSLQKGFNQFSFPVGNLSAGIYIIRVDGPGLRLNQKIKIK